MKPKKCQILAFAITASAQVHAANVYMTADDANGATTSFDSAGKWNVAAAPSAGNAYFNANSAGTANHLFRTPLTTTTAYTFAGDSLTITGTPAVNSTQGIIYKGTNTAVTTITINNLTVNGGNIRSASGDNAPVVFAGNGLAIGPNGAGVQVQGPTTVSAPISGTSFIRIFNADNAGAARVFHIASPANTFTGNVELTQATNARFQLDAGANFKFAVGATGVNNTIFGTGVVFLNGVFDIDLTSAGTTVGNSWTLVAGPTLTETYDAATFSINGFTGDGGTAGSRVWSRPISGTTFYRFSEATGVLSVSQADTDNDGISDLWEDQYFGNNNGIATVEELAFQLGTDDPDGDGADNVAEEKAGTNPNNPSSFPDVDADGLKDSWEVTYFGNIAAQGALGDFDGDLATNIQEYTLGTTPTDPTNWPDTDADDMNDAWETAFFGANNLSKDGSADTDGDSFTDRQEHDAHTNPNNATVSPITSALKNRWSFNGNLSDSAGASPATIVEVGANDVAYNDLTTPTAITMTGGARAASDYISLGTNLLPKSITPVTIELWAKQNAIQNWSRVFDFHSGTTEYLMMAWTRGAADATDQVELVDGGVVANSPDRNQPYGITAEHHIVMTLEPLAGVFGRMKVTVYSAPASAGDLGPARTSFETTSNLVNLNDVVNALGYSPWGGDNTASATYNEARIWNGALVPFVRERLHDQGADNAAIIDSDNDFLADAWETTYFANLTVATTLGDNDSDGIPNREEYQGGSNPNNAASTPEDTDADGLSDAWEISFFGNIAAQAGTGDPDNDGFTNETEETDGTNPIVSADGDGDGLSDVWETTYFTNTTAQDGTGDPDGDGFDNETEETAKSNPIVTASVPTDVDGDGLLDTWEVTYFTNITAQNGTGDPDGDTHTNEAEETAKSNPTLATSIPGDINGDGLADGILFVIADPLGSASFNSGLGWSDLLAPSAGKNYLVPIEGLRTPADANPYTFAGDKLILTTGGSLVVKTTGVITIPYFGLDGGFVNNATNTNVPITLEGGFNVTRQSNLWANNNSIIVNAVVSGTKNLDITRSGTTNTVTFNAVNPFTGNLNVPGGFILGSTGSLAFKPGVTGVTNAITGAGTAVFNGVFNIDLSSAGTTTGDNWTLVSATTLTESYTTTFAVAGFAADAGALGTRKWTSGSYQFDEATGVLTRLAAGAGDSDTDGLADAWETTYFGGLVQSATGDFDGDGSNNLTEYRLGLIPNSGTSRFAATRAATGQLTWPSAVGLTFLIQRSTTLATGSWTTVGTIPGTAGTASFTDPSPPAGKAFYKVLLQP
ncbi:MAG: hypothetical protein V4584_11480 [Verrucomicrobiota bacterium]